MTAVNLKILLFPAMCEPDRSDIVHGGSCKSASGACLWSAAKRGTGGSKWTALALTLSRGVLLIDCGTEASAALPVQPYENQSAIQKTV